MDSGLTLLFGLVVGPVLLVISILPWLALFRLWCYLPDIRRYLAEIAQNTRILAASGRHRLDAEAQRGAAAPSDSPAEPPASAVR